MSSDAAIHAQGLGKCYQLYERPADRLKQLVWGRWRAQPYFREFWALQDVAFAIAPGEVVGVVGRNGAGKSTLLQMVCGTLQPSAGELAVRGRVAALLELGAGFSPEFTGIENIYMNAAILGLSRAQVDERLDDILAFADIGDFVRQPVKTYSSGMFMRLAFSVATSVEPDILVIDEALSVGDGAFARKSFDRIMRLKDAGKTILFCSHSMYQVEALCSRALWMEGGRLRLLGSAAEVTSAYNASLNPTVAVTTAPTAQDTAAPATAETVPTAAPGTGRIVRVQASADGQQGQELDVESQLSDVSITVAFVADPGLPVPTVALGIADSSGQTVASTSALNDHVHLRMNEQGQGEATVVFHKIPLLKGRYSITCFLLTEDGVHVYEHIERCVLLNVRQQGLEQGLVSLPHSWRP